MKFKTILCPLDLTDESKSAVPLAFSMARTFGATLLLVHVVDDAFPYPDVFAWRKPGEDFYKAMRKEASDQLESLIARYGADTKAEKVILQGRPSEEVVALAGERKADLIVLSTHGRTGLDHALMGSQAEKILRRAPCPVLSLKPGQAKG